MSDRQLILAATSFVITVFTAYQFTRFAEDAINIKGESTEGLVGSAVIYGSVFTKFVYPAVLYGNEKAKQIAGAFLLGSTVQAAAISQAEWNIDPYR